MGRSRKAGGVMAGEDVRCWNCGGAGLRTVWSFGVKEPEECRTCDGSGRVWRYPSGLFAKRYAGPLLGRDRITPATRAALNQGTKP